MSSSKLLWSYMWQVTILHQPTTATALGGGSLIFVSVLVPAAVALVRARVEPYSRTLVDSQEEHAVVEPVAPRLREPQAGW